MTRSRSTLPPRSGRDQASIPRLEPAVDVDALARSAGTAWASERLEALRVAGRPAAGGWPGTLREAAGRLLARLDAAGASAPPAEQLQALARSTRAAAAVTWTASAVPDEEP